MSDSQELFGDYVRRKRVEMEIGLREMAKKLEVSPTYLSKVERNEFAPPTEDKVIKLASILGCDVDELMAMANRLPSEFTEIYREKPVAISALLRTTKNMTAEQVEKLAQSARKNNKSW